MAVEVGAAYVSLQASTKELDRSIQKSLDGSVKAADDASKKIGDRLGGGIKSGLDSSAKHAATAGNSIGSKLSSTLTKHMDSSGSKSGDAFGKGFTAKMGGAGKTAMTGLAQTMLGASEGIGSQAGGRFSAGLTAAITRGADGAVAALGKLGGGGWSAGLVTAGTVAAGGVALVGTAAVVALNELYKLGSEWDGIADGITFKTGLIGDSLDAVKESVKNVAAETAASVGDIANISAALIKGLKIPPGDDLEALTQKIAQFNAAAQENGAEPLNIREFVKAMKQMNMDADVGAMSEMLDDLYKVTQNTTIPMNDLVTNLKLLGPAADQFNIPVTGLVQILTALDGAGVDSKNAILGLKTAWRQLGDDPNPAQALRSKLEEIKTLLNSTSEEARIAGEKMATEFFGNKAGPQLAQAIKDGNLELDNFNTKATTAGLTIGEMTSNTEDLSQEWTKFKNFLSNELEPVATAVFGGMNTLIQGTLGVAAQNIKDIQAAWAWLTNSTQGGNIATGEPLAPGPEAAAGILGGAAGTGPGIGINGRSGNAAAGILGGAAGATGGIGIGGGVIGTAGRGFFNSRAAAARLDQMTDAALLSNVPSGRYSQTQAADLTRGLADCSSAVEDLVNIVDGRPTAGRQMATGNAAQWLQSRGFRPGYMPGAFNVGFNSGHMQATLPGGTPFNWGSDSAAANRGIGGSGALDPALTQRYYRYDTGGVLPPGYTLVQNATGEDEIVLNPEQQQALVDSGVDPNALLNGTPHMGSGAKPGPAAQAPDSEMADTLGRVMGYLPAAANSGGVAGTSSLAGIINMGNQVASGLIDTGVSAAQTAVSLAASAGSFGAGGQAAGALAGYGIQLAGTQAKRLASYGFQLGAIGADALVAQLFPFGAPRWIGYDYTSFVPQLNISQIGTTTVEKAMQAQQNQQQGKPVDPNQNPGGPVNPQTLPGMQGVGQPVPQFGNTSAAPITSGPETGPVGTGPLPGPAPADMAPAPTTSPAAPDPNQQTPMDPLKNLFGFDQGGYLEPGQLGINMTGRPEPVLTPQQWDALAASPPTGGDSPMVKIDAIYGMNPEDVANQIEQRQRLAAMRFGGRPY